MANVNQALPQELRDWIAKNNVDLNRVAVMLIRNGREEFLENLNVVVEKQEMPVNANTARQLTDVLTKQYTGMGIKLENLQGRVEKVGSRDAVVVNFQSRPPAVAAPLRQRQVMIPGGGNTYIITCTARADTFDQYLPTFETILASFRAPPPVAKGFDWGRVVSGGVAGGIAGGVIGGLAGIILWFSRKAKRERRGDSTPGAGRV
jgi:hypothetical protein